MYKDKNQPIYKRVEDLISQMTLDEKIQQLKGSMLITFCDKNGKLDLLKFRELAKDGYGRIPQYTTQAFDIDLLMDNYNEIQKYLVEETRLGIPAMTQVECLNGLVVERGAPMPSPILLASTFNRDLANKAGIAIGEQMQSVGAHFGLAPVVDLARDGRWGRVYETFGEDRYLSASLGVSEVNGMQSIEGVKSCAKHFLGYSCPTGGINAAEVAASKREIIEQYAFPFEAMFNVADLEGVMCTYSAIDGLPVSINKEILKDLLRDRLGFKGAAVCDGMSIERVFTHQAIGKDYAEIAALAIKAGLSQDAPRPIAFDYIKEAIDRGLLTEKEIDEVIKDTLRHKFELGLFENPYIDKEKSKRYFEIGYYDELSKQICDEGITLLKNENNFLPLGIDKKIGVVGPHSDSFIDLFGCYTFARAIDMAIALSNGQRTTMAGVFDENTKNGEKSAKVLKKIYELKDDGETKSFQNQLAKEMYNGESIAKAIECQTKTKVNSINGSTFIAQNDEIQIAIEIAKNSDVVIVAIGENCSWGSEAISGEGRDRWDISIPEPQLEILRETLKVNENVILVVLSGRQIAYPKEADKCKAILHAWMPSSQGGNSIADIIFGKTNPSGKLPITMPNFVGQIPLYYCQKASNGYSRPDSDASLSAIIDGGYIDGTYAPKFHFGYGLSYTEFEYSNFKISSNQMSTSGEIQLSITITNIGKREGKETVQVYFGLIGREIMLPLKQLIAYEKVNLKPSQSCEIVFTIFASQLAYLDLNYNLSLSSGKAIFYIGKNSFDNSNSANAQIVGDKVFYNNKRKYFADSCVKNN